MTKYRISITVLESKNRSLVTQHIGKSSLVTDLRHISVQGNSATPHPIMRTNHWYLCTILLFDADDSASLHKLSSFQGTVQNTVVVLPD